MRFIVLLISTFILLACKKAALRGTDQDLVVGSWKVINDSSSSTGTFNGGHNYKGIPDDYFQFTTGGNLFTREGQFFDTATYKISANNQLDIRYSVLSGVHIFKNAPETFTIRKITAHQLSLESGGLTPEGYIVRIINLKK